MADNVAIINATDLSPVLENTQTKTHKERVNVTSGQEGSAATTEVKLTVAQLPSTTGIETMIQSGQVNRLYSILRHVLINASRDNLGRKH